MKKIVFVILVLIAFSGCFEPPTGTSTIEKCENEATPKLRDVCYSWEAYFNKDASYCNNYMRDEPASQEKESQVAMCKAQVIKNDSVCKNLSYEKSRDECYDYLSIETSDLSYCDKIIDKSMRQNCKG